MNIDDKYAGFIISKIGKSIIETKSKNITSPIQCKSNDVYYDTLTFENVLNLFKDLSIIYPKEAKFYVDRINYLDTIFEQLYPFDI